MYLSCVGVIASSIIFLIFAQIGTSQPQQQTIQLNKDSIDSLLQVLQPRCRQELEDALTSQKDLSNDCKGEIQIALQQYNIPVGLGAENEEGGSSSSTPLDEADQNYKPNPYERPSKPSRGDKTPASLLIWFVNSQRSQFLVKKPKKISKKKEEKLRQKGSQQAK
eukprot:gene7550-10289_t